MEILYYILTPIAAYVLGFLLSILIAICSFPLVWVGTKLEKLENEFASVILIGNLFIVGIIRGVLLVYCLDYLILWLEADVVFWWVAVSVLFVSFLQLLAWESSNSFIYEFTLNVSPIIGCVIGIMLFPLPLDKKNEKWIRENTIPLEIIEKEKPKNKKQKDYPYKLYLNDEKPENWGHNLLIESKNIIRIWHYSDEISWDFSDSAIPFYKGEPFTGIIYGLYDTGELMAEIKYKDGHPQDPGTFWYKNLQLWDWQGNLWDEDGSKMDYEKHLKKLLEYNR